MPYEMIRISSYHRSPHKAVRVLRTVFPVLYLITGSSYAQGLWFRTSGAGDPRMPISNHFPVMPPLLGRGPQLQNHCLKGVL